jgi:hypothetical protein
MMMQCRKPLTLSIAAACLAFLTPGLARASANTAANSMAGSTAISPMAQQEAAQMVSAQVHLVKTLDARKTQPGRHFEAVLDSTVRLKDGTELPHGTVLLGKVVTDQMHTSGISRLALRFTEAKLKDGKTIPVHAMIAGVAGPAMYSGYMSSDTPPPAWSHSTLQIDEIGALNHVDLHSRIAGMNSGVFVSTKKDDFKLDAGSQFSLAIAARSNQG